MYSKKQAKYEVIKAA